MEPLSTRARYLWAAPATILGLFLALLALGGGRVRRVEGVVEAHGPVLRWALRHLIPIRGGAAAITFGHVVLAVSQEALDSTRAHERVHVRQYERWGPLFALAYCAASLWALARGHHPYFGNPFERSAECQARTQGDAVGGPLMLFSGSTPTVLTPTDGASFDFGGLGVHWKIDGPQTHGQFAVVHHPLAPKALAAPLHYHQNEDEYSYVLTGSLGALLGDSVVVAGPGTWVFKPRHQWHTFWNAGDIPCEIIEVIAPPGFENYFREVAAAWGDLAAFAAINQKYALGMQFDSVPSLCARFGLRFPNVER